MTAADTRMKKRIKAARRKHGNCCLCRHREQTAGRFHCRNREDRSHGYCEIDHAQPQFLFDDAVLQGFEDANR